MEGYEKIGFKTRLELAGEYQISYSTVNRYLKHIGIDNKNRRLNPKEVRAFYEHFGRP